MLKVNVITTGGTIEKVYSEQTSTVENLDSKIDRYLGRLRLPDCDVRVTPLMNKDSLEMTDADRSAILGLIETNVKRGLTSRNRSRYGYNGSDRSLFEASPDLR